MWVCKVVSSNKWCKMVQGSMVLAKGFCMSSISIELPLESMLHVEKTMLWHQKLGHIGEKGLWDLEKKIMVDGLNDCSLEF